MKYYGMLLFRMVLCLLPLTLLFSCIRDKSQDFGEDIIRPGDMLPEFAVTMDDSTDISTENMKGRISVIVFFNTLCSDCRKELPVIQNVYDNYLWNDDVIVIAISREEESASVSDYWKKNGLTIPFSAQNERKVYELFSTSGIPRIYISDRDMVVKYAHSDIDLPSYDELISEIEVLR